MSNQSTSNAVLSSVQSQTPIQLQHIFGYNNSVHSNLHVINEQEVLYVCGQVIVIYNIDKKTQRFIYTTIQHNSNAHSNSNLSSSYQSTAADIQCICIGYIRAVGSSIKSQILAVAERGDIHKPARVHIYDLNTGKRKVKFPVCNVDAESHDIIDIEFSSDGRYILILHGGPDYMLSQISWDKNKLITSGRVGLQSGLLAHAAYCLIDQSVIAICGNNILRFLHIENNEFKVIPYSNINSVTGSVTHYTCHLWIASMYILCSISGEVSVYDNAEYKGIVQSSKHTAISIHCIIATSKGFIVAGNDSKICVYEYDTQQHNSTSTVPTVSTPQYNNIFKLVRAIEMDHKHQTITSIALNSSEDMLLCSTDNKQIYTVYITSQDINNLDNNNNSAINTTTTTTADSHQLSSNPLNTLFHSGAITGLSICINKPLITTICHNDRTLCMWNYVNKSLELLVNLSDKPTCITLHPTGLHCIVAYNENVHVYDILIDSVKVIHTHAIKQCSVVVYSLCGSKYAIAFDTTIALYNSYTNHCTRTYNIHHSPVISVEFTLDDTSFVSTSTDSTIVHTNIYTNTTQSVLKSKSDVLAQCIVDNIVYASTSNNKLLLSNELNTSSSNTNNYIEINTETSSSAAITCLTTLNGKSTGTLLAGNANGQIVLYSLPINNTCTGSRLYTHSATVCAIAVSPDNQHMFSVAADGVLCMYSINLSELLSSSKHKPSVTTVDQFEFNDNVLIDHTALQNKIQLLSDLEQTITDLYTHNEINIKQCENDTREQLRHITDQHTITIGELSDQHNQVQQTIELVNKKYQAKIIQINQLQSNKLNELKQHCDSKLHGENDRYNVLQQKLDDLEISWSNEYDRLASELSIEKDEISREYESKLESANQHTNALHQQRATMQSEFDHTKSCIDVYVESEVSELKQSYESKLSNERLITLRLRDQNSVLKRKFESLKQDIQHNLDNLSECKQNEQSLYARMNALNYEIECLIKEISERTSTIGEKQERVAELKKKNQELEKFKFVLDYKITELQKQIEPRTTELHTNHNKINTITTTYNNKLNQLKLLQFNSNQLNLKYTAAHNSHIQLQNNIHNTANTYHTIAQQLYSMVHDMACDGSSIDQKSLKNQLINLYQQCAQKSSIDVNALQIKSPVQQYQREIDHLQRTLRSMSMNQVSTTNHTASTKSTHRLQTEHRNLYTQLQQLKTQLDQSIQYRIQRQTQLSKPNQKSSSLMLLKQQIEANQLHIQQLRQLLEQSTVNCDVSSGAVDEKENIVV